MASEYLSKHYPDVKGFSPRSLRRMRDFYRTYENHPSLLSRAMELGWIQNVVIMEADMTMDVRKWYMKAVKKFGWSKTELITNIATNSYEEIVLVIEDEKCDAESQKKYSVTICRVATAIKHSLQYLFQRCRKCEKGRRRRWPTMSYPIFTEKRNAFMRC